MDEKKHFLKGIYGLDSLSIMFILISVIMDLLAIVRPAASFQYLGILGIVFLIPCILRGISRDLERRRRENEIFLDMLAPITNSMDEKQKEREQKKIFKFFDCPACRQRIRVPKGKGRIEITCPQCGTKFIKKT